MKNLIKKLIDKYDLKIVCESYSFDYEFKRQYVYYQLDLKTKKIGLKQEFRQEQNENYFWLSFDYFFHPIKYTTIEELEEELVKEIKKTQPTTILNEIKEIIEEYLELFGNEKQSMESYEVQELKKKIEEKIELLCV